MKVNTIKAVYDKILTIFRVSLTVFPKLIIKMFNKLSTNPARRPRNPHLASSFSVNFTND